MGKTRAHLSYLRAVEKAMAAGFCREYPISVHTCRRIKGQEMLILPPDTSDDEALRVARNSGSWDEVTVQRLSKGDVSPVFRAAPFVKDGVVVEPFTVVILRRVRVSVWADFPFDLLHHRVVDDGKGGLVAVGVDVEAWWNAHMRSGKYPFWGFYRDEWSLPRRVWVRSAERQRVRGAVKLANSHAGDWGDFDWDDM